MTDIASSSAPVDNVSSTVYMRGKPVDVPLDMSFMNLSIVEDLTTIQEPRPVGTKGQAPMRNDEEKFMTRIIRLNNNYFSDLSKFHGVMESIMAEPLLLSWIDLSFNSLTKIDDVFCQFRNLQILYLHGNTIMKLSEVDKLIELPHLSKLSLHGNPIENDKSYRLYVLTQVPQLRNFDMTAITRGDRLTADIWQKNMPIKKKRSRTSSDM